MTSSRGGFDPGEADALEALGTVVVVGAGIAGLSAAHELMERGFTVHVVERASGFDSEGNWGQVLGGLARTQYAPAPRASESDGSQRPIKAPRAWLDFKSKFDFNVANSAATDLVAATATAKATAESEVTAKAAINLAKARLADAEKAAEHAKAKWNDAKQAAEAASGDTEKTAFESADTRRADAEKAAEHAKAKWNDARQAAEAASDLAKKAAEAAAEAIGFDASTEETLDAFLNRHVNYFQKPSIVVRAYSKQLSEPLKEYLTTELKTRICERYPDAKITLTTSAGSPPERWAFDIGPKEGTISDRLTIELESVIVPGEHGYRFFPAYYNHLRDLLQRIPILKGDKPTGRSVFDNLQGSPYMGLASHRGDIAILQRLPGSGFRDRVQNWISSAAFAGTPRDVAQYVNRVLRYMTLCPERRMKLADQSWIEYLIGCDPAHGGRLYTYTDEFLQNLAFAGRVLAALDNRWADARTAGDAFVQLTLSQISAQLKPDGVLNAPTTEAWFEPWRRWLKHNDVHFHEGSLEGFEFDEPSSRLKLTWKEPVKDNCQQPLPDDPDYVLIATDLISAAQILVGSTCADSDDTVIQKVADSPLVKCAKALGTLKPPSSEDLSNARKELQSAAHEAETEGEAFRKADANAYRLRQEFKSKGEARRDTIKKEYTEAIKDVRDRENTLRAAEATRRERWKKLRNLEAEMELHDDAEKGFRKVKEFCLRVYDFAWTSYDPETRARRRRDPNTALGDEPWDRLQTLSGVQYYFAHMFHVVDGHVYYVDAEWGLSAINQQQFWRRRPTFARNGYASVMSVDVGSWRVPSRLRRGSRTVDDDLSDAPHVTAWDLDESGLADEVWRQIRTSLSFRHPLPPGPHGRRDDPGDGDGLPPTSPRRFPHRLPPPLWFHIDDFLTYGNDELGDRVLLRNEAPYLIPVKGDWRNRPGPAPWDPTVREDWPPVSTEVTQSRPYWQGKGGGYPILCEKIVFAGTWLKTFTRMTTMESANESARHAVNAILQHRVFEGSRVASRRVGEDSSAHLARFGWDASYQLDADLRSAGRRVDFGAQELFVATPIGDLCRIWDPEFNEADEFLALRTIDRALMREGKPPLWDLLCLHEIPRHTPNFVDFVDRRASRESVEEQSRSPLGSLHTLARAFGLPGIPLPPSPSGHASTPRASALHIDDIESLIRNALSTGGPLSGNPLDILRDLRIALEYSNRRGHY